MIKQKLIELLGPSYRQHLKRKARLAVDQITKHDNLQMKAVGRALAQCLSDKMNEEELQYILRIEDRRAQLLASSEVIPVVEFGAGSPDALRTKKEMEQGIQRSVSVSNVCTASKSSFWAMVLFRLVRELQPTTCIELGSCVGISAAYQATALTLNGDGSLVTLEGSPSTADIARETLEGLGCTNASVVTGSFQQTLKQVMETVQPIDYFFNDGHHDHDAVLQYFNDSIPYLSEDAIVVFDDISWSSGMKKAWAEIENHSTVTSSINLRTIGIAFVSPSIKQRETIRIPL